MRLAIGLALAVASAAAYSWGDLAQHGAASQLPPLSLRRPLASLRLLASDLRWLAGTLVGVAGWPLYVVALALAPLSLVQAVAAGGIALLALLIARKTGLARREWTGVGLAVAGLALLGLSLGRAVHGGGAGAWVATAIWLGASAVAAGAAAASRSGTGLGLAAGILFAAGDVATKAATAGGWRFAFVVPLAAAYALGFALLQLGFQRGGALATIGISTLAANAVPIVAGLVLFDEPLPHGVLGAARVVSFVLVVAGAALIARRSPTPAQPEPR
jgi:hypothetical protein